MVYLVYIASFYLVDSAFLESFGNYPIFRFGYFFVRGYSPELDSTLILRAQLGKVRSVKLFYFISSENEIPFEVQFTQI